MTAMRMTHFVWWPSTKDDTSWWQSTIDDHYVDDTSWWQSAIDDEQVRWPFRMRIKTLFQLRSRNNAVPTTQFSSPSGRHPNCPQQSWGIKVVMRVNFKSKELTKKKSSYFCVRALFRFFSPSSAGGNSDAARRASSYFCTTNRFTTSFTLMK